MIKFTRLSEFSLRFSYGNPSMSVAEVDLLPCINNDALDLVLLSTIDL